MKRVLIVSYFFPPVSNMGSHRIVRFVRHLREFGWEPIVLTGKPTSFTQNDEQLLEQVPADVEVHRIGNLDLTELWRKFTHHKQSETNASAQAGNASPLKTHGITTFLNRWVMVPDKQFPWIRPGAKEAQRLAREKHVSVIYSTSDPLSDHLVALRAARDTQKPWVAEFRDLWLGSPYITRIQPTGFHRALHARLERNVVESADAIVALSVGIKHYFANTYSDCTPRVIYNCFDPEEYPPVPAEPMDKFRVLYAGALYSSRSPEPFFAGFSQFVRQHGLSPKTAEFAIAGGSADLDLGAMAERHGMTDYFQLLGRLPHEETLQRMQRATLLLAVQSPEDNIHVPGKLFEYVGAGRPVFAISRPCEVADLIHDNQLGWIAEPQAESVAEKLSEAHTAWKKRGHDGLAVAARDRFSAREATRQLAAVFDEVAVAR